MGEISGPRLIDFDAFRAEEQGEPIVVRVGGKDYNLPSSPPAGVALAAIRLLHDGKKLVPPEAVARLAEDLFGVEMLAELTGIHRFTVAELQALIQKVMDEYAQSANPRPNRASRRARKRPSPST